jgi:hypothetical protein
MILVGRASGDGDADERHDVRGGVGEGVKAVREDGDRPRQVSEDDLRDRDAKVEEKNAVEDPDDVGVTVPC